MEEKKIVLTTSDYTKKIKEASKHLMEEYLYIGYLLNEMNENKVYKDKYDSLIQYAEVELGFKKSTVYNCISVMKRFSIKDEDGNYQILSDYEDYNFTQLIYLTKLDDEEIKEKKISPTDSTREIKKKIKDSNRVEKNKIDEIEGQIELIESATDEEHEEHIEKKIEFVEVETVREIYVNPENHFVLSELEIDVIKQFIDKNVELNKMRMDKAGIDRSVYTRLIERVINYGKDR